MNDFDNENMGQRPTATQMRDRPMQAEAMMEKREEFTAGRKHEVFMLAESIVDQVKKAGLRGRERCFLKTMCELLLES